MLYSKSDSLMFRISFQDDPPYKNGFWLFSKDHFRIKIEFINLSDSIFAVEKITPSGDDGNPKIFLKKESDKNLELLDIKILTDYFYTDSFFIDLKPGQEYKDSIDFEDFYDFKFLKGETYELWLEYEPRFPDYKFDDNNRKYPIWNKKVITNKLSFTY